MRRSTVLLALALAFMATEAAAEKMRVRVEVANLREGPGTHHPIVDQAKRGEVLEIIQTDDGWSWIDSPSHLRGVWVHAGLLEPFDEVREQYSPESSFDPDDPLLTVLVLLILFVPGVLVYFLPAMIASARRHHQSRAILVLNLFLGWTGWGWVAALVWAATATQPPGDRARRPTTAEPRR